MSVENDLRKEGIEVVDSLDTLKINSIAKEIAQKLTAGFPEFHFKLGELFIRLSQLKMYTAKVPKGYLQANYFYKNSSIYFNVEVPFSEITKYALHECIHYLQERKDKKGFLLRLGLCDLTQYKVHGLALNEAAVQYATAKALNAPKDTVKYYGITFDTISPNCYPLICKLIEQMAYITDEYVLFDSTFHSNDHFKDAFIEATSEKTFYTLESNFDKILSAEEELLKANHKLENLEHTDISLNKKIAKLKDTIQKLFIDSQNLILTSYFNQAFKEIENLEEVENFRRKLYNYKNVIGSVEGNNFFNSYYINMMDQLEQKYNALENDATSQKITVVSTNPIVLFFQKIRKLFFKSTNENEEVDR